MLGAAGFDDSAGRTFWRRRDDRVEVLHCRARTSGLSLELGIWFGFVPRADLVPEHEGRLRPAKAHCDMRGRVQVSSDGLEAAGRASALWFARWRPLDAVLRAPRGDAVGGRAFRAVGRARLAAAPPPHGVRRTRVGRRRDRPRAARSRGGLLPRASSTSADGSGRTTTSGRHGSTGSRPTPLASDRRRVAHKAAQRRRGRSAANWSVISSCASRKRKTLRRTAAGAARARRSPVGSSTPRRTSTRWRFVAETSCPSAASVEVAQLGDRERRRREREAGVRVRELRAQPLAAGEHDRPVVERGRRQRRRPGARRCRRARRGRRPAGRARGTRSRAPSRAGRARGRCTSRAARGARPRGRRPCRRAGGGSTASSVSPGARIPPGSAQAPRNGRARAARGAPAAGRRVPGGRPRG